MTRALGLCTAILSGAILIGGWIMGIAWMKTPIPGTISTKIATCMSFIPLGFSLFIVGMPNWGCRRFGYANALSGGAALPMVWAVLAVMTQEGMHDEASPAATPMPGLPSVGTALAVLLATFGIWSKTFQLTDCTLARWFGAFVMGGGLVTLLGYLIDKPLLYWGIGIIGNPMGIYTGFLLVLVGLALFFVPRNGEKIE